MENNDYKKILPFIGIIILLLIGGSIYLQKNKGSSPILNTNTPKQTSNGEIDFNDYGPAPDFIGIQKWLNSEPLTMAALKGKVVLIDFWTYSCINCIRTLPYVTKLYNTYKDKGLVVVGVHTPEFAFEKETANVQDAIKRFKINYPVAQDNNFKTWEAYENRYWPAEYLINQDGHIVYMHFGEGNYEITEKAVQQLLKLDTTTQVNASSPEFMRVKSPEMYFGTDRLENLSSKQKASIGGAEYKFPDRLNLNEFALDGGWEFNNEAAHCSGNDCKIKLKFSAGKVHMVASAHDQVTLKITVDGKPQKNVVVKMSELYTLFDSEDYTEHEILIELEPAQTNTFPPDYFNAFTFTFG